MVFHFFLIKAFRGSLMALLISAEFIEGLLISLREVPLIFLTTLGTLLYRGLLFWGVGCIQPQLDVFKSI